MTEGSSSRIIGRTSAFTDLALTTDQTGILLVDQRSLEDERGGTIRLIELDGSRAELEIPNLFAGREWVAALSIDPGGL